MSSPRYVRFREDSHYRVSIPTDICDERTIPSRGARAASRMTPAYCCATLNKTAWFHVLQTKTRERRTSQGVVGTAAFRHRRRGNLQRFGLPNFQIKRSNTIVCRQLRLRHLLLLEFQLQLTILPHVLGDWVGCHGTRDMFDFLLHMHCVCDENKASPL